MRGLRRRAAAAAVLALLGAAGTAHMRLVNPFNGNQLFWSNEDSISIAIQSAGSDDITDDSDEVAIRLAIESWNEVAGTTMQLVEDATPATQNRTDWEANDLHMLVFDEDGDPWLPTGFGIVAITPVFFTGSGSIADADILFNGNEFQFTTSGELGRFDVQGVAAHELGHLLGLDHSGWAGATMYPYVDPETILHRSPSLDEVNGLRAAYPASSFGRIRGTIERASDSSAVERAHVVVRDADGRTIASVLSQPDGDFDVRGLDPGTYTVYAAPFEGPVSKLDLGLNDDPEDPVETDFEPTFYGSTATITSNETIALGTLEVDADVTISLGENIDLYPIRGVAGTASVATVRGTGLVAGSTIAASSADVTITPVTLGTTFATFFVTVDPGAAPGHVDLSITNSSGHVAILPAAIEITPMSPTVTSVTPGVGSMSGGTSLTITGTNFGADAKVVIGDRIYADGDGDMTVVDPTTISLTTNATTPGTHDVVVIDETGVEGRLVTGFQTAAVPQITTVFPAAGAQAGGTEVVITGTDFLPNPTVRIGGVAQTGVTLEGTTLLRFTTSASATPGAKVLEIENTDTSTVNSTFTFAAAADPTLASANPASSPPAGGATITLTGTAFPANVEVLFGADEDTGTGGSAGTGITVVDATTIEVVTPAHPKGTATILVRDTVTGQTAVLASGFQFKSSGGGGGGCSMRPVLGPPAPPSRALAASWWIAALGATLLLRGHMARRGAAQPVRAPVRR